jgi:ribosomal protein L15E
MHIKSKASIYKLKLFSTKYYYYNNTKNKKYIEILLKKTHKQFENMKKSNGSPGPPYRTNELLVTSCNFIQVF